MLVTVVLVVTAVVTAVWAYSRYRHNYWASRGVPYIPGALPLMGHLLKTMSSSHPRWLFIDEAYKKHGADKICGLYEMLKPYLIVGDPDLIKTVLIKDFDHFVDRRNFTFETETDKIWNNVLTNTTGEHWKGLRSVLSPTFSSGKMKGMFPLVEKKAEELASYIQREVKSNSSIPLRKTFGLYTLEIISSCAFGMETNSLVDGDSVFVKKVEKFFEMPPIRIFKTFLFMMVPKLCNALGVTGSIPESKFFQDVVEETIRKRQEGAKRGDFLDLMMEAREDQKNPTSKAPKYKLCNSTVVANAILFILAGYDTTANTLCFAAFELARNPKEQKRVRQELQNIIKEHGELTYQSIMEANILEAAISETLRLNPPAHFTERVCTKKYKMPETNLTIPEEMVVSIPIWSLHHDPRYFPDPEVFSLDRFLPHNRDNIKSGTYLPFGLGPRNCIGMRFAQMEAKLALAKVLLNFELSCLPGQEELKLSKLFGIMRPADDLSLIFTPLEKKE